MHGVLLTAGGKSFKVVVVVSLTPLHWTEQPVALVTPLHQVSWFDNVWFMLIGAEEGRTFISVAGSWGRSWTERFKIKSHIQPPDDMGSVLYLDY